jgi:tryptophan-rich sensory protein
MFLGNMWNVVFFGRNKLKESLPWMGAFWGSIAATIASFYTVSPTAAALVAPTLVWVTIASKLNYDIVKLNTRKADDGKQE